MRAALFSKTVITETQALIGALERRGHTIDVLDLAHIGIEQFDGAYWRELLVAYDLVYYRNGLGTAGRSLLRDELQRYSGVLINPGLYNPLCQDKAYQTVRAASEGIRVPKTLLGRPSFEEVRDSLGAPFVVKGVQGIQGKQVRKIETEEEYTNARAEIPGDLLYQQLVPNSGDFRVFVVGDEVIGSYKRTPPPGAFLSNISQGGTGQPVTDASLQHALAEIARAAAGALELDVTGVDIIQSDQDDSLFFLEANGTPGWKGLDAALGMKSAERIAEYFERRVAE